MTKRPLLNIEAVLLIALAWFYAAPGEGQGRSLNGFDLSDPLVPVDEILHGGPPRDGIPAIDHPRFIPAAKADYLKANDRVLGVARHGVARAYPVRILNWHEIVNDRIDGEAIVVSFCPLCGTGMVFGADVGGKSTDFGVSGLLYNSDMLLYDRATESLWSQVMAQAIAGPSKGQRLREIPVMHTTWADWRRRHPDTVVLSTDTGFNRDYERTPYAGYAESRAVYFSVRHKAPPTYHPKERVLGLRIGDAAKAYPFVELARHGHTRIADSLAGEDIIVHWDEAARTAWATRGDGDELPGVVGFWFAWFAFHPETLIWQEGGKQIGAGPTNPGKPASPAGGD